MNIGGETDPDRLGPDAWATFGAQTGFSFPVLRRFGVEMAQRAKAALTGLMGEPTAQNPAIKSDVYPVTRRNKFFKRYAGVVETNCDRLIRSFSPR